MENENKRVRSKYVKKERARLIKLAQLAYNSDPRIKREKEMIEAEKQKVKQAKKDYKTNEALKVAQMQKENDDKKALEASAAKDAENAVKEASKQLAIAFRNKIKELVELCKVKLAGTKYDKFWVESIMKRFGSVEKIQPIIDNL